MLLTRGSQLLKAHTLIETFHLVSGSIECGSTSVADNDTGSDLELYDH